MSELSAARASVGSERTYTMQRCEACGDLLRWDFPDGYSFDAWKAHWTEAGWHHGMVRGAHGWIFESWLCARCYAVGNRMVSELQPWTPEEAEAQRAMLTLRFPKVQFEAGRLYDGSPCVFYTVPKDYSGGPITPGRLDSVAESFVKIHGGQASLFEGVPA